MCNKSIEILDYLKSCASPDNVAGMARFGIRPKHALGISVKDLRKLAREIKKNHTLAIDLWNSGIHEARLLAAFIEEPQKVDENQMDRWVNDFDSWDICDQVCGNVFDKTPYAYLKAIEWADSQKEFVKRAGFALMAELAVHDKKADDQKFYPFFELIKMHATDHRNYVRKAVNWALRQMGKRNKQLNAIALQCAEELLLLNNQTARWIATDAIRELKIHQTKFNYQ